MTQSRWIAIGVFVCASLLNYLDRQLLAAVKPTIGLEFHISNKDYGWLIAVSSILYSFSAPLMGLLIDKIGLNWGITIAVGGWSLITMATAMTHSFTGLVVCRGLLGIAQAGGVPASGKAFAMYLAPAERALGNSLSQSGISLGSFTAPLLASAFDWRTSFTIAGALGFVWIPVWWLISRRVPAQPLLVTDRKISIRAILSDSRYWIFVAATMLGMTGYSWWTNWVTSYLVDTFQVSQAQANSQFAWIPPLMGLVGGLTGGSISLYFSRQGWPIHQARMRAVWMGCFGMLLTAVVPFAPSALVAAVVMAISYFCATVFSVNLYSMPLEVFGRERAAFAISSLTSAYGLMQAVMSVAAGSIIDHYGFKLVCMVIAVLPLCAAFLLSRVKVAV